MLQMRIEYSILILEDVKAIGEWEGILRSLNGPQLMRKVNNLVSIIFLYRNGPIDQSGRSPSWHGGENIRKPRVQVPIGPCNL